MSNSDLKALIVDDDRSICSFIQSFVENDGFHTTVLTEPEKFETVYNSDFCLIFLDLNMPNVDGIELIRYLGKINSQAEIILTSAAEKSILRAAQGLALSQQLNVLDILVKPIEAEKLAKMVTSCRERVRSRSSFTKTSDPLKTQGTLELPSLTEFKKALADDHFDVYFQPKIKLSDKRFVGIEALARWHHETKGTIPPDFFIVFAERYGLIGELTEQLLRKICQYIRSWSHIPEPYQVSVNISEISLGDLAFPEMISRVSTEYDIDPSRFMLEITESTLSSNQMTALDVLTRLRLRGFQLSLDDYGTGHSSLSRLSQYPFSELKIDRSFIDSTDTDPESRIIIKNTIELAENLGLSVVAEGVERQAHIDILTEFKCDTVQGYFFSKPLPNDQFLEWLSVWLQDSQEP